MTTPGSAGHTGAVLCLARAGGRGHLLVSGGQDGRVKLFDPRSRRGLEKSVATLSAGYHPVRSLAATVGNADWSTVVCADGGKSGTLHVYDSRMPRGFNDRLYSACDAPNLDNLDLLNVLQPRGADGASAIGGGVFQGRAGSGAKSAFAPPFRNSGGGGGGQHGCAPRWVKGSHGPKGNSVAKLAGHTSRCTTVAMSEDGACVVTGSDDATVRFWDVRRSVDFACAGSENQGSGGDLELSFEGVRSNGGSSLNQPHEQRVRSNGYSGNEREVPCLEHSEQRLLLQGPVTSVSLDPAGRTAMATDLKGNVYSSTVVSSSNNDNQPSSPSPSSHPFASVGDNGQEEHKEGLKGACRGGGGGRAAGKECSWDDGWAPPLQGVVGGGGGVGGDSSLSRLSDNGGVSPLGQPTSMPQPSVLEVGVGGGRRAVRFGSLSGRALCSAVTPDGFYGLTGSDADDDCSLRVFDFRLLFTPRELLSLKRNNGGGEGAAAAAPHNNGDRVSSSSASSSASASSCLSASSAHDNLFSVADLKRAGFGVKALRAARLSASALLGGGFSVVELAAGGFSGRDLVETGLAGVADLRACSGFDDCAILRDLGFSCSDLKDCGFNLRELFESGFSVGDLSKVGVRGKALRDLGCSVGDTLDAAWDLGRQAYFTELTSLALEWELVTEHSVGVMRENIEEGTFSLAYYTDMWEVRLEVETTRVRHCSVRSRNNSRAYSTTVGAEGSSVQRSSTPGGGGGELEVVEEILFNDDWEGLARVKEANRESQEKEGLEEDSDEEDFEVVGESEEEEEEDPEGDFGSRLSAAAGKATKANAANFAGNEADDLENVEVAAAAVKKKAASVPARVPRRRNLRANTTLLPSPGVLASLTFDNTTGHEHSVTLKSPLELASEQVPSPWGTPLVSRPGTSDTTAAGGAGGSRGDRVRNGTKGSSDLVGGRGEVGGGGGGSGGGSFESYLGAVDTVDGGDGSHGEEGLEEAWARAQQGEKSAQNGQAGNHRPLTSDSKAAIVASGRLPGSEGGLPVGGQQLRARDLFRATSPAHQQPPESPPNSNSNRPNSRGQLSSSGSDSSDSSDSNSSARAPHPQRRVAGGEGGGGGPRRRGSRGESGGAAPGMWSAGSAGLGDLEGTSIEEGDVSPPTPAQLDGVLEHGGTAPSRARGPGDIRKGQRRGKEAKL